MPENKGIAHRIIISEIISNGFGLGVCFHKFSADAEMPEENTLFRNVQPGLDFKPVRYRQYGSVRTGNSICHPASE
ncbi:hypothetical protein SDC9_143554 [bioreactor metagenome]|uniref:Uncharacterized protein n=1 Tax=bioreactor metagenome TaxID=1076179 RepID=A0A645E494_9ZZZZ